MNTVAVIIYVLHTMDMIWSVLFVPTVLSMDLERKTGDF